MKRLLTEVVNSKFTIHRMSGRTETNSFAHDVLTGLSSEIKYLQPKYFYDDKGSHLFDLICTTPEYYLTRIESSIIEKYAEYITLDNGDKRTVVELGSGSSIKTRLLLSSFLKVKGTLKYMPIDVSDVLINTCSELVNDFPGLYVDGILAEYEDGLKLVKEIDMQPTLFLFLGSSIGNFNLEDGINFIKYISICLHPHDNLLIGFDMVKDKEVLNRAYNDEAGYTEQFNKNILERINKELGGQFQTSAFKHHAFFNEKESRMEMHLISRENQFVYISELNMEFYFKKGESIHTENSYKFTTHMINNIAELSELKVIREFTDNKKYFSLVEFELK